MNTQSGCWPLPPRLLPGRPRRFPPGGGRDRAAHLPVIPSSARPSARGRRAAGAGRRLPVAAALVPPAAPRDVLYGFGRIDAAGRVANRAVISALGWRRGDRLTLTAEAGVVTARRDPAGMTVMTAKPYIAIPAALRRRCGLEPGDQVLLAAVPAADILAAYPLAVVDQAIRAHGSSPHAQGGKP